MIVYLLHNIINGMIYIGWSSTRFEARWKIHLEVAKSGAKYHLSRAIRKYKPEAFTYEILNNVNSKEEAKYLEKLWIITLRSYDPKVGYNMTFGGDGCCWDLIPKERQEEIKEKRSQSLRNRWKFPTEKQLQAGKKSSFKLKGRISGPSPFKGKTSIEILGVEKALIKSRKLSIAAKGVIKGIWVTNGVKNRVITSQIPKGWIPGRVQKKPKSRGKDSQDWILKRIASTKATWVKKRAEGTAASTSFCSKETRSKLSEAAKRRWSKEKMISTILSPEPVTGEVRCIN